MLAFLRADGAYDQFTLAPSTGAHANTILGSAGGYDFTADSQGFGVPISTATGVFDFSAGNGMTGSSADHQFFYIKPKVNQTGTAGYNGLYVDVTETSVGSGSRNIVNFANGGSSKMVLTSAGRVGIGTTTPASPLHISTGSFGQVELLRLANTNGGGNATSMGFYVAGTKQSEIIAYDNNLTLNTATASGSMLFQTNGTSRIAVANTGNVGIGTTSPTYALSVSGDVNVTGNFRVNGTVLSGGGGANQTGVASISNSSGDITLAPAVGTGAVQINSGAASTSPTTGALIVSGGVGVSGGIYSGGVISSGSSVYATTSVYTPQLYGTSTASGDIKVDGTSNATKGNVLLSSAGGNVGIGTTNPTGNLSFSGDAAQTIKMERNTTGSNTGNSLTVSAGGATATASNVNGGSLYLTSGTARGDGRSSIELQVVQPGQGSGTTERMPATILDLFKDSSGNNFYRMPGYTNIIWSDAINGGKITSGNTYPGVDVLGWTYGAHAFISQALVVGQNDYATTSSVVDIRSTTKGLLIPRMTTTQRNAIATPATGLQIYNTTTNSFDYYNGSSWAQIGTSNVGPTLTDITNISNASGDITLAPAVGTGAVQINSGAASTSPTTGALIVTGGVGVSGGIYSGGAISSGSTVSASTSVYTPQLYGTSTPSGNILIDGTSNATKGNVLLATSGGKVGIGTTTPTGILDVQGGTAASGVAGANINLVAQTSNVAGGATGGSIYLTPGLGSGGWNAGGVFITRGYFGVDIGHTTSYVPTSTSSQAPTSMMSLSNSWPGNGALTITDVVNSSGLYQRSYNGFISKAGAANYSADYVIGFKTGASAYNETFRIQGSTGNVGIGTTSPGAQLQTNTSAVGTIGQIIKWGQAGQTANLLEFQNDTGTILSRVDKDGKFYGDGSGLTGITATPAGATGQLQFNSGSSTMAADSNLTWDNTNKFLGIGTGAPAHPLHVYKSWNGQSIMMLDNPTNGNLAAASVVVNSSGSGIQLDAVAPSHVLAQWAGRSRVTTNSTTLGLDLVSSVAGADMRLYTGGNSPADERLRITSTGNVGIGTTTPAYALSVSGDVNVTGSFRVNGTVLSGAGGAGGAMTGVTSVENASGDITIAAQSVSGTVYVNSGKDSVSATSGALVVTGGVGISSDLNVQGNINSGLTISATNTMLTPQLYGTTTASGNIKIDGTSNASKGNVLLSSAGGNVGIGTTTPTGKLHVEGSTTAYTLYAKGSGQNVAYVEGSGASSYASMVVNNVSSNRDVATLYADAGKTSGNILNISTGNANFTGNAIAMDMGVYTSGNFTGNFLEFKNSGGTGSNGGPTKFSVNSSGSIYSAGSVGIGTALDPNYSFAVSSNSNTGVVGDFDDNSGGRNSGSILTVDSDSADDSGYNLFHVTNQNTASSKFVVRGDGNVGIGTSSPTEKLTVNGAIRATASITSAYSSDTDLNIDFSTSNIVTTSASCGSVTLSNMLDGGSYTLIVTGSSSGVCNFSHSGVSAFKFSPANAATDTGSGGETVYTFLKVGAKVYVSWITGMR